MFQGISGVWSIRMHLHWHGGTVLDPSRERMSIEGDKTLSIEGVYSSVECKAMDLTMKLITLSYSTTPSEDH